VVGLEPAQQEKLLAAARATESAAAALGRVFQTGGGQGDLEKAALLAARERELKLPGDLLSEEQQKEWRRLVGAPFDTVTLDRIPDAGSPNSVYYVMKTTSVTVQQYTVELTFVPVDGASIKQQVTPSGTTTLRYTVVLGPSVPIKGVTARVLVDVPVGEVTLRDLAPK
jgi:hypothetical protein